MRRKPVIMHILNTGSYSGAENVVMTIINNLHEYEHVYVSLDGPIRSILKQNKIRFFPVKKLSFFEIRRAIRTLRPSVIHAHDFTAGIVSVLTGTRIPIINHLHNNSPWIKEYGWRSFAYCIACLRFKRILTVSSSVMDEYVFGKFFRSKTTIMGNPIDLGRIRKMSGNEDAKKDIDVIFLGRLSAQKRPELFIDIIKKLAKNDPGIKAVMVGDGELNEKVRSLIEKSGLCENISMLGFQDNPYVILKRARVMCMPSSWEGFGLAAVESLALGVPVFASPVGGLKNIVDNSCGGLCNNREEFIRKIEKCLNDKKNYETVSKGAYLKAAKICDVKKYMGKLKKIYYVSSKKKAVSGGK